MNVYVVMHNAGVALLTQSKDKVNEFLKELIGKNKIVVDGDEEGQELSSVDELFDMAEVRGDCGEMLTCYFGVEMGDDYCELAITLREVE